MYVILQSRPWCEDTEACHSLGYNDTEEEEEVQIDDADDVIEDSIDTQERCG